MLTDAVELRPEQKNSVALADERSKDSNRTAARLLESSLRLRPGWLILGEVRGGKPYYFLKAINIGRPGSISTIHVDSPALALERIALLVIQTGVPLTWQDVIEYASAPIDMFIQVRRRNVKRGVL